MASKKRKKSNKNSRFSSKWLLILLVVLSVAVIGGRILVLRSSAECTYVYDPYLKETVCVTYNPEPDPIPGGDSGNNTPYDPTDYTIPNPTLTPSCQMGFDVAFLVDTSGSVIGEPLQQERSAVKGFIKALKGQPMMFSTSRIDNGGGAFTYDTNQALSDVDSGTIGQSHSYIGVANSVLYRDQRKASQNLVIVLTDGRFEWAPMMLGNGGIDELKQKGTRVLGIGVGDIDLDSLKRVFGKAVNTGSIYTSDVITTNYDQLGGQLLSAATQLCKHSSGGGGEGDGSGDGNGGDGSGAGTLGNGTGGSSSSGGSSATKLGNKPSTIPTSTSQGTQSEQKTNKPSPFFDGKLFSTGSDSTVQAMNTYIKKPLTRVWPLVLGVFLVGTASGVVWWIRYRRKK